MIDKIMQLGRPAAFGLAGVAAGMLLGKSKKQKNQLALGYGSVGAIVGYASGKIEEEEVAGAVEAAEEAEAIAMEGFGWGAPQVSKQAVVNTSSSSSSTPKKIVALRPVLPKLAVQQAQPAQSMNVKMKPAVSLAPVIRAAAPVQKSASPSLNVSTKAVAPIVSSAVKVSPSVSGSKGISMYNPQQLGPAPLPPGFPTVKRKFGGPVYRKLSARKFLPYRRLVQPKIAYRPAVPPLIRPRRIVRPRVLLPYRPIVYPRPRFYNAAKYLRPRILPQRYIPPSGTYNYFGAGNTPACRFLLKKITRMTRRLQRGLPVVKVGGQPLSPAEALPYLEKLKAAYARYCAQRY